MQAIILAAGMGKRLGKLTQNNTKCMVEVGGVRLIERVLYILDKKNLSRIRARRWRLWTSLKTEWTGHVWLWMGTTGLPALFRESC